jgi:hypothetical protein
VLAFGVNLASGELFGELEKVDKANFEDQSVLHDASSLLNLL